MHRLFLLASLFLAILALAACQNTASQSAGTFGDHHDAPSSGLQSFKGVGDNWGPDNGLKPGSPMPFTGGFRGY